MAALSAPLSFTLIDLNRLHKADPTQAWHAETCGDAGDLPLHGMHWELRHSGQHHLYKACEMATFARLSTCVTACGCCNTCFMHVLLQLTST